MLQVLFDLCLVEHAEAEPWIQRADYVGVGSANTLLLQGQL